jgi:hypothetical protein
MRAPCGACGAIAATNCGWYGRTPPYGVDYAAKNAYLNRVDR